jgi:hypothetical protein
MQFVLAAKSAVGYVLNQIAGLAKALKFSATAASFTAGMAKRLPPAGPFAAALVVQGKAADASASDTVVVSRGTQISGNFYANFDPTQGDISLWFTPEWAGADGLNHYFAQWSTNGYFAKNAAGNLILSVASGKSATVACAFVAGTTYHLVARYDSKATIDSSNYLCISVNDVHTFGLTSSYTPEAPSATITIGHAADGSSAAAGVIQGFVFSRIPWWDGATGIDLQVGDIINLVYNAGTGADVAELLGSFDTTLSIPTNATPGALTSGSTDAHSHPHGSELLTDAFMQTAYASSAWSDVGTPVTPVSVQYNGISTVTNAGTEGTVDNLPTADFTAELWLRPDRVNSNNDYLLFKNVDATHQWYLRLNASAQLNFYCYFGTTAINYVIAHGMKVGQWNHIVLAYNATAKTGSIAVGGIWLGTSAAGSGTYGADEAANLLLGNNNSTAWLLAAMGWLRISSIVNRYTVGTNFTPPPRGICPADDANTVRLYPMNECSGTDIADNSVNNQHGTGSNITWNTTRDIATVSPGERIYMAGYEFAADAAGEGITQTISSLSPGADMVIRPVLHYTPSAIPKVLVLDATNADAVISSMTLPDQTANLVLNGGFDSDTGSWTALNATLASVAGGISGNCIEITTTAGYGNCYQTIQLQPRATYRLTGWHKKGTGTLATFGVYSSGWLNYVNSGSTSWAQLTVVFTAPASGLVQIHCDGGSGVGTYYFDSITLTRVISASKPWCESLALSLPTVAREGADATWEAAHYEVVSDCVSIKIQVIDTAGLGGITTVHMVEAL